MSSKKPFRSIENLLSDETRSDEDETGPIPLKACNEKRKPSRKTDEDKDCEMRNLKISSQPRGRDASPKAKDHHHPTRTKINLCNL